jgi:hypothetical protein
MSINMATMVHRIVVRLTARAGASVEVAIELIEASNKRIAAMEAGSAIEDD